MTNKVWLGVAGVIVVGLGLLVVAWCRSEWKLSEAAQIGDAAGPIVGLFSLGAVVAALWSVALQREALAEQKRELSLQHDALQKQMNHQRHAALRDVYVPFLTAASAYNDAVSEYVARMSASFQPDRSERKVMRQPLDDAKRATNRALDAVLIVDPSEERRELRWALLQTVRVEPWHDTVANQKDWTTVMLFRLSERTRALVALRASLRAEFGYPERERSEALRVADEKHHAALEKQAEAIETRTNAERAAALNALRRAREAMDSPMKDDD